MIRISLFILFFYCTLTLSGATYYVATNGSDSNPGTITQPWASWQKGFSSLKAGDILYIRGGTYTAVLGSQAGAYHGVRAASIKGTSGSHVTVAAYGTEVPILNCSGLTSGAGAHYGITMDNCSYWDIYGLTVTNVREYSSGSSYPYTGSGWETAGCTNMRYTLCSVSGCMNGFTLGGSNDYIYYVNCDSYSNYDYYNKGGLCNGFNGNLSKGGHVFYDGCRSWSNSDDGYDNMAGGGYITYTNCWSFRNGYDTPTSGDGDGFKLGYTTYGDESGVQRTVYNCIATNNKLMGFDESMDIATSMDMVVYNCTSYNNANDNGFRFYQPLGTGVTTLRNNVSYLNRVNYQGRSRNISDHNSWDAGAPAISGADFVSVSIAGLDGPRKADGSLPDISFLHLASGSKLIDAGVDVGLPYTGKAPDLGAFEITGSPTIAIPVFVSAVVEDATPQVIGITYSITLANIVPGTSAFSVMVNSSPGTVNSVAVSGTKVNLTLASPVVISDVVTVAYTQPATNPLQTASGGKAETIGPQSVTNKIAAPVPAYAGSSVENGAPSVLVVIFNLTLADIVPAASSFTVMVNSVKRSVSSVSVSGTKVLLTLSSPAASGDVITVAYTKPSSNPLQTSNGGQAATFGAQKVSNNVTFPAPVYVSSVIQNAAPSLLVMTYNTSLANIVPSTSAFSVLVNSVSRTVSSVTISGSSVQLTLSSPVVYGNVVTVSYSKPSVNPLQTSDGPQAESLNAQKVTNNVAAPPPVYVSSSVENAAPSVLVMNYSVSLANIVPSASSFSVLVNSTDRSVSSVSVSGTSVNLTLAGPVVYGDVVTVAYTQPATRPLQTSSGGEAETIGPQSVSNKVTAPPPVYAGSSVENGAPSVLVLIFNLTLADIVPAASSFTVMINSVKRSVSSVSVSGTKVFLTLSSPIASGDVITVAYTKPSSNPLQTSNGGQAATFGAQKVSNNVTFPAPVYVSSVIQNAAPSLLVMTYNTSLANIVPSTSAFSVLVNSVSRTVSSVTISGSTVQLTLSSPVVYGNVVTVSYSKPSVNPLQTSDGPQAESLNAQKVTNNVAAPPPVYVSSSVENAAPSVLVMNYSVSLANIVPSASSFSVLVNTTDRSVSSVSVSGTSVNLTLASPVVYGDVVTVAYTQPATNPLQTASGGKAETIAPQSVSNKVTAPPPVYAGSSVENGAPSVLVLIFNLTLADIVPAASSFTAMVNSVKRSVSSVSVSGTKVLLTLSSPAASGDVITVAYTKPSSNPLQTSDGGQAATFGAQKVSNNVTFPAPVYVSSVIQNAAPSLLVMTYNTSLANIVPSTSAFSVLVNSVSRRVSSVIISGSTVQLTVSSPVVYGNVVTVSYSKPSVNPLQTSDGPQAASLNAQKVTNNIAAPPPVYVSSSVENAAPSVLVMNYSVSLANIVPSASSFSVLVNTTDRSVSSVSVSGTSVNLTLASPVVYGDVVTVAYNRPATRPLQTSSGGEAETIAPQPVTNRVAAPPPVYAGSSVENGAPSVLVMTYSLSLADVVPAASSFTVMVNSVKRSVSSVSVSGTKVLLTLSSPAASGDVISVAYTKPSSNPLQTPAGVQAATIGAMKVTNNVTLAAPVYVSSVIQNTSPSLLVMTYNLSLADIVPAGSAFSVLVNSVSRTVSSVAVSGSTVQLTLSSPVAYGNVVTVSYNKPSVNPLQTAAGIQAISLSAQKVTNNIANPINAAPKVSITSPSTNSTFKTSSDITISAVSSDSDGSITLVEFYSGTTRLGSVSSAPYSFTWTNVAKGVYSLTAVATDNKGANTTSAAISIAVSDQSNPVSRNKRPHVAISIPHKGIKFASPADIDIEVTASDSDGMVTRVEIFNGTEKLTELTSSPYLYTWKGVTAGTYEISAVATDDQNATDTSDVVDFLVTDIPVFDGKSEIINLYPNPNNGHFTIEFKEPLKTEKNEIIISDLSGTLIFRAPVEAEEISKEVYLPNVRSGLYIMSVISGEILVTKKIIIK